MSDNHPHASDTTIRTKYGAIKFGGRRSYIIQSLTRLCRFKFSSIANCKL